MWSTFSGEESSVRKIWEMLTNYELISSINIASSCPQQPLFLFKINHCCLYERQLSRTKDFVSRFPRENTPNHTFPFNFLFLQWKCKNEFPETWKLAHLANAEQSLTCKFPVATFILHCSSRNIIHIRRLITTKRKLNTSV